MKPWTTETSDQKFSILIRAREPKCARCKTRASSDCSHHFERHHSATRFHPENCDGVCRKCHDYWHAHMQEYIDFKKEQLGPQRYIDLQRLAWSTMKRETAIIKFMKSLEK